ncbi:MAG: Maltose O-acetyltransferase [Polaromonas sp.]|nr:Maltose O-acetyltransferase [Polaromonas sp.]
MNPSEKEKMLAGALYDARDPQLAAERLHARNLLAAYNMSPADDPVRRQAILADLIPACGEDVCIEPPFHCDYGSHITVGHHVFVNFVCTILDVAPVNIGSGVLIGPAVQIYAATHPLSAAERRRGLELGKPVHIGDEVWIGGGAIICPGVRIGCRSVIAAGSVVTRDIAADVLAAGNPCGIVRPLI